MWACDSVSYSGVGVVMSSFIACLSVDRMSLLVSELSQRALSSPRLAVALWPVRPGACRSVIRSVVVYTKSSRVSGRAV